MKRTYEQKQADVESYLESLNYGELMHKIRHPEFPEELDACLDELVQRCVKYKTQADFYKKMLNNSLKAS